MDNDLPPHHESLHTSERPAAAQTDLGGTQSPPPPPPPPLPLIQNTGIRDSSANPNPTSEGTVEVRRETRSVGYWEDEHDTELGGSHSNQPLPPLPEEITPRALPHPDPRVMPLNTRRVSILPGLQPEVDWIVPREDRPIRRKTAGERLDPTLITALEEKDKYAFKAKLTGFALNAAIGMQVVLGALTTGLSVVTTGHQTQIMTAVLGGIATIVASYLARARGSNEPELSITRVKDLEQFIRDCEAFKMDHGHILDDTQDDKLIDFRRRFEDLLGNASGERKLSA